MSRDSRAGSQSTKYPALNERAEENSISAALVLHDAVQAVTLAKYSRAIQFGLMYHKITGNTHDGDLGRAL